MKRTVLIVDNSPGLTGAFKSISSVTQRLKDDYDFHFCLPEGSALTELSGSMRPTFTLPFRELSKGPGLVFYLPALLINSLRLVTFIRAKNVDVLHVNDLYNLVGVVVKILLPRVKVVYHIRLLPTSYAATLYRAWIGLIERFADHIICVSEAVRKNLRERDNISLVRDGIDADRARRTERKGERDVVRMLYLANYIPGKGHDHAIHAFAGALKQDGRLRLLMAGGDLGRAKNRTYKAELKALAVRHKVADRVEFGDFAEDTARLFGAVDIFLNFSDSESFSMTCLEALTHGLPVIATDCGGPRELFVAGESGLLVPVGDVQAMSDAILTLSADPVLRRTMGEKAASHARCQFHENDTARQLKDIYDRILAIK